jgi:hypothetical protein
VCYMAIEIRSSKLGLEIGSGSSLQ